jgi:hypothetical protein
VTDFVVQDGAAGQPGGHCLPGNRGEVSPSSGKQIEQTDFFVELGREKVQFDAKTSAAFQKLFKNDYRKTAF